MEYIILFRKVPLFDVIIDDVNLGIPIESVYRYDGGYPGGSFINRSRLLNEIAKEVRKVWHQDKILGARITGTDHLKDGLNYKDSIYLTKKLENIGFDYIDCSQSSN